MKRILVTGWCIEANGEIQMGQSEIPYFWNESEKDVAEEFMDGEYVSDDRPKLIHVEMRRLPKRK